MTFWSFGKRWLNISSHRPKRSKTCVNCGTKGSWYRLLRYG